MSGLDERRYIGCLQDVADQFELEADLIRRGGHNPSAEAQAGRCMERVYAIRWAIKEIESLAAQVASFKESTAQE